MTTPNFDQMSKSELKAYLITHVNDTQAFYALMDKVKAEPNPVYYSLEDIDRLEELIEARRQSEGDAA